MTRERKTLLIILIICTVLLLTLSTYYYWHDKNIQLQENIRLINSQITRMKERTDTSPESTDKNKTTVLQLYKEQSKTTLLYPFGQEIKEQFETLGLQINRYQEITSREKHGIDFYLEGSVSQILFFLQELKTNEIAISYISLDCQNSPSRVSLSVSPIALPRDFPNEWIEKLNKSVLENQNLETPQKEIRTISSKLLSNIFFSKQNIPEKTKEEASIIEAQINPIVDTTSISFIGKISSDGTDKRLYFKDNRNQQVFSVVIGQSHNDSEWTVKELLNKKYQLVYKNNIYEVSQ